MGIPHYQLETVKSLVQQNKVRLTQRAAQESESEYQLKPEDVNTVILELTTDDFDSTTISRQTNRQNDVYIKSVYSPAYGRLLKTYIKLEILTIINNETLILISFHSSF